MRPFLLFWGLLCAIMATAQEQRIALVVGNGRYAHASLGETPLNDARQMAETLRRAGFDVTFRTDLDLNTFSTVAADFGRKIKNSGAVALFYYSGHGVQYRGQNWLVPIGAELADEEDIDGACIPIERITSRMQNAGTPLNLIFLDACRTYPLRRVNKDLDKGLAEMPRFPEMLVAFATAPGAVASNQGEGGLSLFTSQLLQQLQKPGLPLEDVLRNTRREVIARSGGKQRPEETSNLTVKFFFFPLQPDPTPPVGGKPVENKTGTPATQPPVTELKNPVSPGADRDFDGTPDADDKCPDEVGSEKAFGCPDADDDGVPDKTDRCPRAAGPKGRGGCPDTDNDGIDDGEDQCPTQAGDAAHKGCPPPDADGDGVSDAEDQCPNQKGSARFFGCPDTDNDGFPDHKDKCPNQKGLAQFGGCPDTDGDKVPDNEDKCPNDPGPGTTDGCPPLLRLGLKPDHFVRIPGGSFKREGYNVTVGAFDLYRYEVTVAQFKLFIESTQYQTDAEKGDGSYIWTGTEWKKTAGINWRHDERGKIRPDSEQNYPVVHVSWNDADAYCKWLSTQTRQTYRLPTEAEWEYAAGNGSKHSTYSWGNGDPSGKQGGNIADESAKKIYKDWSVFSGYTDGYVYAAPVGSFNANELGLYDMSGNVWEWCSDWYGAYPKEDLQNPTGPADGASRVNRGGSWYYGASNARVSYRNGWAPGNRNDSLGFRLARAVNF